MGGVELECEYRRAAPSSVAAILFTGLTVLFSMGALARTPDGGPVSSAQPVYAVLAGVFGLLGLVAVVRRVQVGRRGPARIVMTDSAILLPRSSWSDQEVAIVYSDLQEVFRSSWYSQSFINIVHRQGKHMIPISSLPSAEAFEEILSRLQERVP